MIAELERCFEPAPLPNWFYAFEEDPQKAIGDLLFGRFYLDSLNTDEPEDLLIDWANFTSRQTGFLPLLDGALERWINDNWGQFPEVSAGRLAVAWCRAADVVAFVEHMEKAAAALLNHFEECDAYLGALSDGPSRDSLGRYLFAIARYQKDTTLAPFWWELCNLNAGVPFYHGRYAMAGVRGLPEQDAGRGGFRSDVALALVKLGRALDRLVAEGLVSQPTAEEFFVGVGWHTVGAYPFRSRWHQVFGPIVNEASERLSRWLRKVLPEVDKPVHDVGSEVARIARFNPAWPERGRQLSRQLAANPESALSEAERLIAEQRAFAEASGDAEGLTKTLSAFSRASRGNDASQAAQWAEEAMKWSPWDPVTWTLWIKALQMAGRVSEALGAAWSALERFPENAFVCTELTHLLIASGRVQEAEQIALEGVEWFPNNRHCWVMLATVLREKPDNARSEEIWRKILDRFPDDGQGWGNLAKALVLQRKFQEAESELWRGLDISPDDLYLRNFLGAVLSREGKLPQSEEVLRAAKYLGDDVTKISLAGAVRKQRRIEEALSLVEQVLKATPAYPYALAEKARILEGMGRFAEASAILESLRLRGFRADEQDLLADFLEANRDRDQEGSELHPPSPKIEQLPSVTPTREDTAKLEEPPNQSTADLLLIPFQTQDLSDRKAHPSGKPTAPVRQESTSLAPHQRRRVLTGPPLTKLEPWKLSAAISEARLLRRWAHRNQISNEPPPPAELLNKSAHLLDDLLSRAPHHPRACLEKAYLLIERGSLEEARLFLEEQITVLPNQLGLRQALGRVNRELARQQELRFDQERYLMLTKPLQEIQQRNPGLRPLTYLGRGRVCFAMTDGLPLRNAASRDFKRLRKYTTEKPDVRDEFRAWWSGQIDGLLFANIDPHADLSSDNIGVVQQALKTNQHRIDTLEEDFTFRMSR